MHMQGAGSDLCLKGDTKHIKKGGKKKHFNRAENMSGKSFAAFLEWDKYACIVCIYIYIYIYSWLHGEILFCFETQMSATGK